MSATVTPLHRVPAHPALSTDAPPMNVGAYVHSIMEAATSLMRNGLVVAGFNADGDNRTAALRIEDCRLARRMVELGQANYVKSGHDEDGPYRVGMFYRCGVTVFWNERLPS